MRSAKQLIISILTSQPLLAIVLGGCNYIERFSNAEIYWFPETRASYPSVDAIGVLYLASLVTELSSSYTVAKTLTTDQPARRYLVNLHRAWSRTVRIFDCVGRTVTNSILSGWSHFGNSPRGVNSWVLGVVHSQGLNISPEYHTAVSVMRRLSRYMSLTRVNPRLIEPLAPLVVSVTFSKDWRALP